MKPSTYKSSFKKMKFQNFFFLTIILSFTILFKTSVAQDVSFIAHIVDSDFDGPAGIFVADINNDGNKDIICSALDAGTIAWWENQPGNSITWQKHIVDDNFPDAIYCSAYDVDGDNLTDVLGAAYNSNVIAWWHNDGGNPIQWTKQVIETGYNGAHEIMAYDIDMDNDLDILGVSAEGNTIAWFENDGNYPVQWTKHIVDNNFIGARSVDAGDLDNDGDIDLAGAALLSNEITWWRNEGGSPIEWTEFTISSNYTYSHKVHIVDIDLDGDPDILGMAYTSGLKWWRNDGGDPITWEQQNISGFGTGVIAYAVDINQDNDFDIISSYQGSGNIFLFNNEGNNTLNWDYQLIDNTLDGAWPLSYGDFDNDGDIDIVCGGRDENEIRWYENDLIEPETVTDYDGNIYNTVIIGQQTWLKENLKSLHYADGSEITEVWAYDDDEANVETYGRLYTWDGAMNYSTTQGSQGACPNGWHIPTDTEWTELGTFLGGDNVAGGKLKEAGTAHWQSPNSGATNESGFTALPAGEYDDTHYQLLYQYAVMWSSTETSSTWCKYRYLSYDDTELHTYNYYKDFRYSVRCIKDATGGSTIHVPGDQSTIQAGIDIAQPGDTVLVAPGTYFENINFNGKNIVVASHYVLEKDLSFIALTIINGSEAEYPDTASCVRIVSGEDSTAVIQGFTICQGTGTHWVDPQFPTYTWHSGGGIFIFQSSPSIKNNHILNNHVDDDTGVDGASGGGICMYGGNPVVINNIIENNTALYGAGVVIDYSGCTFKNNIVAQNSGGQNYGGGGFWTIGNGEQDIIIENNTIVENESVSKGGAMYLWSTHLTARNNIIWGNTQTTGNQVFLYSGANADISYTDIEGGYTGEGNIDIMPEFSDTAFILAPGSPCIDSGNPDGIFNDPEDTQNPGQAIWPAQGQLTNDMGAYGGPLSCLLQDISTGITKRPRAFQKINIRVSPNPFSGFTRISLEGTFFDSVLSLEISDLTGRRIKRFSEIPQNTEFIWDGRDENHNKVNSGLYILRLISGKQTFTTKIFLIKP
jgi:uncharacterized protein (TIGR02145 family)